MSQAAAKGPRLQSVRSLLFRALDLNPTLALDLDLDPALALAPVGVATMGGGTGGYCRSWQYLELARGYLR